MSKLTRHGKTRLKIASFVAALLLTAHVLDHTMCQAGGVATIPTPMPKTVVPPASRDASSSYSATLPNGATVSVLALRYLQSGPPVWSPSGGSVEQSVQSQVLNPTLESATRYHYLYSDSRSQLGRLITIGVQYANAKQPNLDWVTPTKRDYVNYLGRNDAQSGRVMVVPEYDYCFAVPGVSWESAGNFPITHLSPAPLLSISHSHGVGSEDVINLPEQFFGNSAIYPNEPYTIQVGVAAGKWSRVIRSPKRAGTTTVRTPKGRVTVLLYRMSAEEGIQVAENPDQWGIDVSDDFDAIDKTGPAPPDKSGVGRFDRLVVALDAKGRAVREFYNYRFRGGGKDAISAQQNVSTPVLRRIASFEVMARPYYWATFKMWRLSRNTEWMPTTCTYE